jgi:hypothetical protein
MRATTHAEIGVGMAFGANARRIFRLIVGRGMHSATLGITIGLVVALAVTRAMQSVLVGGEGDGPAHLLSPSRGCSWWWRRSRDWSWRARGAAGPLVAPLTQEHPGRRWVS